MRKRTIFGRIFASFFVLSFMFLLLSTILSFRLIEKHYIDSIANNLKKVAISLKCSVKPYLINNDYTQLNDFLREIKNDIDTRITVIQENGTVIADSEKDPAKMENHSDRFEISEAFKGNIERSFRMSPTLKKRMLYIAVPVKTADNINANIKYVLRVSVFDSQLDTLLNSLKIRMIILFLGIMIISIVIAVFFSRRFYKPIVDLVAVSQEIANGNFDAKIFLHTDDEFKILGDSLNSMNAQIKKLFDEVSFKKEELDAIISSMQEGLCLIDGGSKIIFVNQSFADILNEPEIEKRYFWEVFRYPELEKLTNKIRKDKISISREINIDNKTYLFSGLYINKQNRIIIMLHNISEIKEAKILKKSLVSNVSHELKTPLTAIHGFTETLLADETDESKIHILKVIERNSIRLKNLVNDISSLNYLEENYLKENNNLDLEEFNLSDLINDIVLLFEQKVKKKKLSLNISLLDNITINADKNKIEELIINLLDNAIKYTDHGEISISIIQADTNIVLIIKDTGIGIPVNKIPLIFQRFYVVDKSRSKKQGGTGLGLAIVKHIVELYSGNIQVNSVVNEGTEIIVELPVMKE